MEYSDEQIEALESLGRVKREKKKKKHEPVAVKDEEEGEEKKEASFVPVLKKERDLDRLDMEAQVEHTTGEEKIAEEKEPKIEVKESVPEKELRKETRYVWYDGIVDDLRTIASPNDKLSDEEWEKRRKVADEIRRRGAKIPPLTTDVSDRVAYNNRQQLQGAIEYLNPLYVGKYRREALAYLKNLGIGNGEGVPYLSKPVEDGNKKVEDKEERIEIKDEGKIDKEPRIIQIQNELIKLSELGEGKERYDLLSSLENKGIKIRKFLDDMERAAPGKSKDLMRQMRVVVGVWKMDEVKKKEYPSMTKTAEIYARVLGL